LPARYLFFRNHFRGDFVNALGTIILLGLLSLVKGIFEDKITDVFSFSLNIGIYFKKHQKVTC